MAPVVRFIERLCIHLKNRFPEDNKLCNWCIFDNSCIKQANFNFGLNELQQLLKQFSHFFHCYDHKHEKDTLKHGSSTGAISPPSGRFWPSGGHL